MAGRRGTRGTRSARAWPAALPPLAAVLLVAVALAARPRGADVHRLDGDCEACHTADAVTLHADAQAAKTLVAPDLEERCNACHGDEGPSHKTGVAPTKPVPDSLPLTEGKLTCATCHFMHGEANAGEDFCRIDNRRGELCLTCHDLSELE